MIPVNALLGWRARLAFLLGAGAAAALPACQLPVALGGFGVLAGLGGGDPQQKGDPGKSDSSGTDPEQKGSPNVPVSTTGGGLPRGTVTLVGKVVLDGRTSADGVEVKLQGEGGHSATIRTDATGVFRFENIAPGDYQFQAAKSGYSSVDLPQVAVPREDLDIVLKSPVVRIELSAASDSIYPPAAAGEFPLASQPPRLQLTARIVKSNGDKVNGTPDNMGLAVNPPDQATVSATDFMLATTPEAAGGTLTITAKTRDGAIEQVLSVKVIEAKSSAGIRVVSLGEPR